MNDATPNFQDDATNTRNPALIPWIVVGLASVLAILVSILVMNLSRGGADVSADPIQTTEPAVTSPKPTTSPTTKPTAEPTPSSDRAPSVDVGTTSSMRIDQWNAVTDVSGRFGALNYVFDGETMQITSALTDSFPASCGAAMKTGWGIERVAGTSYKVVKPAGQCADSPELYDQVWGLMQAMADAIKPA
ncbi:MULTISPECIES: hypothetical protein [unclassified Leucobacter]|uniref:hypothetical protein n=1 Tax=unclassified Leucobacter TaxID=2621730 RepID=UPI00165D9807|nr:MULTISPECIES: hypothetical protein [unclassified Leucobacter]MBC9928196.1 hypothetical protein [Leucobacter sp. cx-169]MBC9936862.1 hypothetical protein [Leucobacter sp. cx-87]